MGAAGCHLPTVIIPSHPGEITQGFHGKGVGKTDRVGYSPVCSPRGWTIHQSQGVLKVWILKVLGHPPDLSEVTHI